MAAKQGHPEAQYEIGYCYENGEGSEKDYDKAAKWYRKVAEHGYAEAQYALGSCYCYGLGVEKDNIAAAQWLRKAAEQGHFEAKLALKEHYKNGGVYSCAFIGKSKHFLDNEILPQKWSLTIEKKLEPPN